MKLQNVTAEQLEGWFVCYCGCKYWNDLKLYGTYASTICSSCGDEYQKSLDNPINK